MSPDLRFTSLDGNLGCAGADGLVLASQSPSLWVGVLRVQGMWLRAQRRWHGRVLRVRALLAVFIIKYHMGPGCPELEAPPDSGSQASTCGGSCLVQGWKDKADTDPPHGRVLYSFISVFLKQTKNQAVKKCPY